MQYLWFFRTGMKATNSQSRILLQNQEDELAAQQTPTTSILNDDVVKFANRWDVNDGCRLSR